MSILYIFTRVIKAMRNWMNQFYLYFSIFKLVGKGQIIKLIYYFLITIVEGLIPVAQVYLLKKLTDSIALFLSGNNPITQVLFFILLQFTLLLMNQIILSYKSLIKTRLTQYLSFSIDSSISEKLKKIPYIYFEKSENYNLIERVTSGLGAKFVIGLTSILSILKYSIMLIGYSLLLYKLHWSLALLLIILLLPSLYTNIGISKSHFLFNQSQTHMNRRSNYLFSLFSNKVVQKELRIFDHGKYLANLWKNFFWKTADEQFELEKKAAGKKNFNITINQAVSTLFMIGLLWIGQINNTMTIGDFVAFSSLLSMSINSIQFLSNEIGGFFSQNLYLSEYNLFMNLEEDKQQSKLFKNKLESGITFRNVSFKYPNSDKYALKNISFTISSKEVVVIVGDNGSGKSTLVKCLIGLYNPQDGEILFDDVDSRKLAGSEKNKKLSVLFQDFFRYDLSFKENIILSQVDEGFDKVKYCNVINNAKLSDIISDLPNYDATPLGKTLQDGIELSGGEWQRVALSRALYKESEILVLDEPTAAIDPLTEADILSSFMDICNGKTSIIVTHRLGSCLYADKIIVLKEGEVAEIGTHSELIQQEGVYFNMFHSQAKNYIDADKKLEFS